MRMRHAAFVLLPAVVFLSTAGSARPGHAEEQFAARIAWQQAEEPAAFRSFRKQFVAAWAADEMAGMARLFSPQFEGADKTLGFLQFIKGDHGALADLQFKYFDTLKQRSRPRPLAVYHAVFDDGSWWALRLGLDDTGLTDRLILTDPNYNEVLPVRLSTAQYELPFNDGEQWFVLWGGRSEEMNYHATARSQRNALDLLIKHPYSGQSYSGDGGANTDYYAFGREVLAPVDGVVVEVVDGIEDNVPGEMNPGELTGNTVVIRDAHDEYLLLAHFQADSIRVQEGDKVSVGDRLGRVGNSGNSSEPHLHMQLMTGPSMRDAEGIEIRFRELLVHDRAIVKNYSPVRSDVIARRDGTLASATR